MATFVQLGTSMAAIFSDGKTSNFDNVQLLKREELACIIAWVNLDTYRDQFDAHDEKWYPSLRRKFFEKNSNVNRIELEMLMAMTKKFGITKPVLKIHPGDESSGSYYRLRQKGASCDELLARRRQWRDAALTEAGAELASNNDEQHGQGATISVKDWLSSQSWDGFRSTSELFADYKRDTCNDNLSLCKFGLALSRRSGLVKSTSQGRKGYRQVEPPAPLTTRNPPDSEFQSMLDQLSRMSVEQLRAAVDAGEFAGSVRIEVHGAVTEEHQ